MNNTPDFQVLKDSLISALTFLDQGNPVVEPEQKTAAIEMLHYLANWSLDLNIVHLRPDDIIVDTKLIKQIVDGNVESQKI